MEYVSKGTVKVVSISICNNYNCLIIYTTLIFFRHRVHVELRYFSSNIQKCLSFSYKLFQFADMTNTYICFYKYFNHMKSFAALFSIHVIRVIISDVLQKKTWLSLIACDHIFPQNKSCKS